MCAENATGQAPPNASPPVSFSRVLRRRQKDRIIPPSVATVKVADDVFVKNENKNNDAGAAAPQNEDDDGILAETENDDGILVEDDAARR